MSLYITLAIILELLLASRTESTELPMINAGNFAIPQTVPLSYRRRLGFGLRPLQRCLSCTQNLLLNTYLSRNGQHGVPQIYNIFKQTSTEKTFYRRFYDADAPHIELQIPAHLRSAMVTADKTKIDKNHREQIDVLLNLSKNIDHVVTSSEDIDPDHQISMNANSSIIPGTGMGSDSTLDELTPTSFDELYSKVLNEGPINKSTAENTTSLIIEHNEMSENKYSTLSNVVIDNSMSSEENDTEILSSLDKNRSLANALEKIGCKFYEINFDKFSALSPTTHGESGRSFVQSGLFLALALIALSAEVDSDTKKEIEEIFGTAAPNLTDLDKINLTRRVIGSLPESREGLRFRWSSHLVLGQGREVSDQFKAGAAAALQLKIDHFERNQTPAAMAQFLNRMIEKSTDIKSVVNAKINKKNLQIEEDSGAIRDTFEESDLTDNEEAVLITTLYFRARWRSAPTLLNGTWRFRDAQDIPTRTVRMIRINDVMNYMDIPEWDAEAIEIPYMTQGLTLLMLVPRGNSLKPLVEHVTSANFSSLLHRMKPMRIAARVPLYTLRMTLLLPNKLQAMGISRLVNASDAADSSLRLSQAVQRIMFWAEAGRNAFKDDGLEWDVDPEKEVVVDRPYIFYVRWHNLTIMNGNFAL